MSILIKGLNLPKEELNQERLTITIWANGCVTNDGDWVRNEDGTYRKEYWNYEQFSAVELPPHGDLIDRDALMKDGWLSLHKEVIRMGGYAIHELPLKNPTIPVVIEREND